MAASRVPGWVVLGFLACGTQDQLSLGAIPPEAGSTEGGAPAEASDESGLMLRQCVGLQCNVNSSCPNGGHTTLTGKVFDPAGQNPLYSVLVFVPTDPAGALPPIAPGTRTCNTCDASIGRYVAATTTDATGSFTLSDVPTGSHVPLVVQTGKFRREQFVQTTDCANTAVPASVTRLPRNRSEGDMPQMALLTGGCDDLGCFMRSVGIDASEFSSPHGGGRLDVYRGDNGPGLSTGDAGNCTYTSTASGGSGCGLWSTRRDLEYYDMVLLACECDENTQAKPANALTAMHDWLDEGGKVFATHYHYTWFQYGGPDFQGVATWLGPSIAAGSGTYQFDTSFFKGQKLHDWLANLGALSDGGIPLNSVATSTSTVHAPAVRWIYDQSTSPEDAKYLSFTTPVGGIGTGADGGPDPNYCGKAVFTDLHTSGAPSGDVPSACTPGTLTPQQKALEFLFFDLSACVAPDTMAPPLPPPSPP